VEIVQTLDKALSVPVTCKIRMLDTPEATIALCKALEGAGCSMLTVHGRTKVCVFTALASAVDIAP